MTGRARCYLEFDASGSPSHDLHCMPLRLIAGMFDEISAPHDCKGDFYGVGPAAACPDVAGAIRRGVIACSAYRARWRDEGVGAFGALPSGGAHLSRISSVVSRHASCTETPPRPVRQLLVEAVEVEEVGRLRKTFED